MAANSKFAVAIHTAAVLACHKGEFVTSDLIASSVNTNPVVVRRVLCALTKSGIVESQMGKAGGSRLIKLPSKISLLDIYQAVEDEGIFALHDKPENRKCPVSCCMKRTLQEVFNKADQALRASLAKTTLAQIVQFA